MKVIKEPGVQSPLIQSRYFNKILPSHKDNKTLSFIKAFFKKMAVYFKAQTSHLKKERFLQILQKGPTSFAWDDIYSLYKNFLSHDKDCPPSLIKNIEQLSKFKQDLIKIDSVKNPKKKDALLKNKKTHLLTEFRQLKNGETKLFYLENDTLLCKITKQANDQYTLQFIGPSEVMQNLIGKGQKTIAGKEKFQRELVIANVASVDYLIPHFMQSDDKEDLKALLSSENFKDKKIVTTPQELSSITNTGGKTFWNLVHIYSPEKEKRIKLKAELSQLFEMFHLNYSQIKTNPQIHDEMTRLLKMVSNNTLRAYEKQQIGKDDLNVIQKELNIVAKRLRNQKIKTSKAPLGKVTFKPISLNCAQRLDKKPEPFVNTPTSFTISDRSQGIPLKLELKDLSISIEPLALNPYQSIGTKELFLETLKDLNNRYRDQPTKENQEEFLEFLRQVPLTAFEEGDSVYAKRNANSFWSKLTPSETTETLNKIVETTKKIGNDPFFKANLTQKNFESFFKSVYIIYSLESSLADKSPYHDSSLLVMYWHYLNPKPSTAIEEYKVSIDFLGHNFQRTHPDSKNLFNEVNASSQTQDPKVKPRGEFDSYDKIHYKNMNDQLHLIEQISGKSATLSELFIPTFMRQWIRPISNPFLFSAYRQATAWITNVSSYDKEDSQNYSYSHNSSSLFDDKIKKTGKDLKTLVNEKMGLMSPEAFHDDPQAIFKYFLQDYTDVIKTMKEESPKEREMNLDENLLGSTSLTFTIQEQKRLLNLLRTEDPQGEIIAFMQDFPHLLNDPSVRNFIDSLFFNGSLTKFLDFKDRSYNRQPLIDSLPNHLDAQIQRLTLKIKEAEETSDPKLAKMRLDALLYLYEMQEKLKQIYSSYQMIGFRVLKNKKSLQQLKEIAIKNNDFDAMGVIARIDQRRLLAKGTIDDTNLSAILQNFMLIWGSSTNPENIDPSFDSDLKTIWKKLLKTLDQQTKNKLLPSYLDHFVYSQNLKVDGSLWVHKKDNVFANDTYEIDLDKLSISTISKKNPIKTIPYSIQNNPLFIKVFPDLKASFPVQMETKDNITVYFFQDVSGLDCRIEQIKDDLFIYKKMKVDEKEQWLLYVPIEADTKLPLEIKKSKNPFQIFKNLVQELNHLNETNPTLPFLRNDQLYINPETLKGVILDDLQKPLFKVVVKNGKDRITLSSVTDLREHNPSTWQVNHAGSTQHPLIQELSKIDRPENILLWQQDKKLKKIELYRYGLQFAVDGNRLKCLNKEYAGYYLKPDATLQDKNQFSYSLLLEHTDPTKPKKLIVPDPTALQMDTELLLPHAKGIARLIYILKQLIQMIKGTFNPEKVGVSKPILSFDNNLKTISYKAYDLRAYTNEICQKEKAGLEGFLERMQHALITQQFEKAHEHFLKYEWESINAEKLNKISAFLQHSSSGSNIESALKLKMIFKLYTHLKENKRLTNSVKKSLHQLILKETKLYLAAGRRIPLSLELTEKEKLRAFHISKTLDPHYAKDNSIEDIEAVNKEYKAKKQKIPTIQAKIDALETRIPLKEELTDEQLKAQIHRLIETDQVPLLFAKEKVKHLFNAHQTVLPPLKLKNDPKLSEAERIGIKAFQADLDAYALKQNSTFRYEAKSPALKSFIKKELLPLKASYEAKLIKFQTQIEQLTHTSSNPEEQLRILAKEQDVASFDEIRIAFSNGTLQALKDKQRLPQTINLAALTTELTNYFDALSHRNALSASLDLAESMLKTKTPNKKLWESQSTALEKLLTMKRGYDATKDPSLLVFEGQQFINFRFIDGGIPQVEMLEAFLKNPFGIIQAPTGAGKSTFSNLRALLKPNGKNLVIQCVLPPLFEQAYHKMNEVIGDLYGTHVYALKYRPSQAHTYRELVKYEENGEKKERFENVSIFKKMYLELLQTIENKGCVLTDYTSFPMLEEKYFKILDTMAEKKESKEAIDPMLIEHYNYLRKILILKDNRSDMLMDEFDQPNRPTQKTQLDLGIGSKDLPPFIADTSLQIFEILEKDPSLGLLKNIQGDINPTIRVKSIQNAAIEMAATLSKGENEAFQKAVLDYFLGKNKDIIPLMKDKDKSYRDQITLCKDQFTIYLPLTLSWNRTTRYDRSDDQQRTLPASKGDKREAKFGTILEQMNVRIQDYLQGGVTEYDVVEWFKGKKQDFENGNEAEKTRIKEQIACIFPGKEVSDIDDGLKNPLTLIPLIQEINQDIEKVKFFLKIRLSELKTSGKVISLNPQNIIDSNRAVSGTSATMDDPDSIHNQFVINKEMDGIIRANMAYKLTTNALGNNVITYDPEKPEEILLKAPNDISAIIDGAGAFKKSTQKTADALLKKNKDLEQVGYHEKEAITFEGHPTGDLKKTGFVFNQAHTRGTDIKLSSNAKAVITVSEDGLRDLCQFRGRLRDEAQEHMLAVTKDSGVKTIEDQVTKSVCIDALNDGKNIFRKLKDEPKALLRKEAREKLLEEDDLDIALEFFSQPGIKALFITEAEKAYHTPGDYADANQDLRLDNQLTKEALIGQKNKFLALAEKLGLTQAKAAIEKLDYSDALLAKLSEKVAPIGDGEDELEVEKEVEIEQEMEAEVEKEMEVQVQIEQENVKEEQKVVVGSYPIRKKNETVHSLQEVTGIAYDPAINFSDSFVPLSRKNTGSSLKRNLFDSSQPRVGIVFLTITDNKIVTITVEDPIEDSAHYLGSARSSTDGIFYDTRTNQMLTKKRWNEKQTEYIKTPKFAQLISQVKFLNGQLSGYSEGEVQELSKWLKINNKDGAMKNHLMNQILQYRHMDKLDFPGSQLDQIFQGISE